MCSCVRYNSWFNILVSFQLSLILSCQRPVVKIIHVQIFKSNKDYKNKLFIDLWKYLKLVQIFNLENKTMNFKTCI